MWEFVTFVKNHILRVDSLVFSVSNIISLKSWCIANSRVIFVSFLLLFYCQSNLFLFCNFGLSFQQHAWFAATEKGVMSSKESNWFPEGFILLPKPQAYDLLPGQDLLIAGTPSFWTGGNKLRSRITSPNELFLFSLKVLKLVFHILLEVTFAFSLNVFTEYNELNYNKN